MNRTTLPINEIIVEDRQRKDYGDIESLAESIRLHGLIQPIVINQEKRLIAGGRRLAASHLLGATTIDIVYRETLSDDELHILELEENLHRKDETWQERVCHIKTIHDLKKKQAALDSATWGQRETAAMLGIKGVSNINIALRYAELILAGDQEIIACEQLADAIRVSLRRDQERLEAELAKGAFNAPALTLGFAQAGPEAEGGMDAMGQVALEAPSAKDAFDLSTLNTNERDHILALRDRARGSGYLDLNESEARTLYLANPLNPPEEFQTYYKERRESCSATEQDKLKIPLSKTLFNCNSIEFMLANPDVFDHIITDPPYGIDVAMMDQNYGSLQNVETVTAEHDVEANLELFTKFFPAAFTTLKSDAFCITWCDAWNFRYMSDLATKAGFKAQRWPFVWVKPIEDSSCANSAAYTNFTKRTEFALVCRKGVVTLTEANRHNYVIASNADEITNDSDHPFAKPYEVWAPLIKAVAIRGQTILEPFAGEGSGVLSMLQLGQRVVACESNTTHFNKMVDKVKQHYMNISPNFLFI